MDIKLAAVKSYRAHLHDQYVDRSACWALQELSRDSLSGCLVVLLDGIDQQKFAIPRDKNLRASAALNPAKLLTTTLIFFDHLLNHGLSLHCSPVLSQQQPRWK